MFVVILPEQDRPLASTQTAINMNKASFISTNEGRYHDMHANDVATMFPDWLVEGSQVDACFGCSVATAGDVNGDGYSDIIIGDPYYDSGWSKDGRVWLYYGSSGGLSTTSDWTVGSEQTNAHFGSSTGTAGDVNNDGYSDVIIGAPNYINDQGYRGRVYVYYGSAVGLSQTPDWTVENDQFGNNFGYSVGTAGDVNNDGYSDVIVGAPWLDDMETGYGQVYVYYGGMNGLSATPAWMVAGDQHLDMFASLVGTAGDVNGDGYSDVFTRAYTYSNDQIHEGRAYVYHSSSEGLSLIPDWLDEGDQDEANFGWSVGAAGDINGDGYSDLIVGGYYWNGLMDEGRAHVYYGGSGGLSTTPAWTAQSDQDGSQFSQSVGAAGDVNGDGYSDVIIGSPKYNSERGRTYVYHGDANGLGAFPAWTADGYSYFGMPVGIAGDVNGDGYSDVFISEPSLQRVYVFHGDASGLAQVHTIFLPLTLR